jgi:hypothetical protein
VAGGEDVKATAFAGKSLGAGRDGGISGGCAAIRVRGRFVRRGLMGIPGIEPQRTFEQRLGVVFRYPNSAIRTVAIGK